MLGVPQIAGVWHHERGDRAQSRDRFSAGVTDNIEVVQAQGSVAIANDNLISALYAHNLAKVELARALGSAEQQIQKFMEVK